MPAQELAAQVSASKTAMELRAVAEEVTGMVPARGLVRDKVDGSPAPTAVGVSPTLGTMLECTQNE